MKMEPNLKTLAYLALVPGILLLGYGLVTAIFSEPVVVGDEQFDADSHFGVLKGLTLTVGGGLLVLTSATLAIAAALAGTRTAGNWGPPG